MHTLQDKKIDIQLNSFQIKIFAIIVMLIDHIGAFILNYDNALYPVCRGIGRLAFPIFCWMIAEGAQHTHSMEDYLGRLIACAIISTPPYNLVHGAEWYSLEKKNVFFTLFLGLLVIQVIRKLAPWTFRKLNKASFAKNENACILFSLPIIMILYFYAYDWQTDYGGYGVAVIVIFYILRRNQPAAWTTFALFTFICYDFVFVCSDPTLSMPNVINMNLYDIFKYQVWNGNYAIQFVNARQMLAVLAFIPISLYNGQKGRDGVKYFFYLFYPLHLLLIWLIQLLVL